MRAATQYSHVFAAPVIRPRAVNPARAILAEPRRMELESDIGQSPRFPRGWYIVPGIVTLLAIGIAVIV